MIKRLFFFAYGASAYLLFVLTFLYAIGFIGNVWTPKSIDTGAQEPLAKAIIIDTGLLTIFALQHSIMARKWFKQAWTRIVPQPIERSTYVLATCAALGLMFWQWRPLGGVLWDIQNEVGRMMVMNLYWFGFALVLVSTFLIDHFDLFGLRQVWLALIGKEYTHHAFQIRALYRYVRHPLYLGFLIAFWAAPTMTAARLFFALVTTAYILTAIRFEEKDLVADHGQAYSLYQGMVPMILPTMPTKSVSQRVEMITRTNSLETMGD